MHKKLVAPITVAILLIAAFCAYMLLWVNLPVPLIIKIIFMAAQAGGIGVTVFVLVERIKEIRSGEEDDLSQY